MIAGHNINALPPFRYDPRLGKIWGVSAKGGEALVCDIRGWGYLTGGGHGALGLSQEEGVALQNNTGEAIADGLNAQFPT